jgi:adenylate cyclase class 2
MAQEIEIKLRIGDSEALRLTLGKLGARFVGNGSGRVHEWNVLFDTPKGALGKRGQLLRIRTETPDAKSNGARPASAQRILLTFKSPPKDVPISPNAKGQSGRHKVREESELEVADATVLAKIFEGLGMNGWFCYEKYRTTYRLPDALAWAKGLLIEIDETPIGTFVELEGPPKAIDRAAKELGFSADDYILQNYLSLYMDDCAQRGEKPGDMVFARAK